MKPIPLLSLTIGAALATAAPAAAATVSPEGVRFPQAAIDDGGATVVAWERRVKGSFAIEARSGASATTLGRTHRLAGRGFRPQVAIGADGTRAIMWMQYDSNREQAIRVAIARPGRRFGEGRIVERRRSTLAPVDVAVQRGGRVVAVWHRAARLRYALASRGHGFAKAQTLGAGGVGSTLAVDGRDGTIVVPIAPAAPAQAAVRTLAPSASAFSEPVAVQTGALPGAAVSEVGPSAVSGPGGAAVAYVLNGDPRVLALVRRNADGSWAAGQRIAIAAYGENVFATDLQATLATDGSAVAAWSVQTEAAGGLGGILSRTTVASIAPSAAPFGAAQALSPGPPRRFAAPSVAAAGAEAFVASAEPHGAVLLSTRPAGATTFSTRSLAADGDGDALLAAAGRHVIAIYQQDDRLRLKIVR